MAFSSANSIVEQLASPVTAAYDLALWDLAGKMSGLPVHALIGTYRTRVPAYASTIDGAVTGPLSTPESYGEFARQCLEMGYRGFKIHPMAWPDVQTHVDCVLAVGERVGGKMDAMIDPYCLYPTFSDALKVGRACDKAGIDRWSPNRLRHSAGTEIRRRFGLEAAQVHPRVHRPGRHHAGKRSAG